MKRTSFRISGELLADALRLPAGTQFIWADYDGMTAQVRFVVTHESLTDVPDGSISESDPEFRKNERGDVEFAGWNQR